MMRAKLRVRGITHYSESEQVAFSAVAKSDGPYNADGSGDENSTFARWTPQAYLTMTINNPALLGQFEVGQEFYVDFTKVGG